MAQHDFSIANQTFPATRADLNNALEALATLSSGATAPTTTYPDMLWYDTANNILKMRSEADDAWINIGYLDQSTNEFKPYVGGTQVDTQPTADWEAGTSTTEGIVSPAKVKAAVNSLVPDNALVPDDASKVGALAFCGKVGSVSVGYGQSIAGSSLRSAEVGRFPSSNGAYISNDDNFAGTWRCLGRLTASEGVSGGDEFGLASLFVRVA